MDEYTGTILLWAGNWVPPDWMICAGQSIPVAQNQALYAIIGNTYGGTLNISFNLPDLRSRVPVGGGMGQSPSVGTTINLGQIGGHDTITLNQNQIPAHTHALMVNNGQATANLPTNSETIAAPNTPAGRSTTPTNGFISGASNTALHASSIAANTGGQAHDNMQPYLGLNYIICVNGTFPPHQ